MGIERVAVKDISKEQWIVHEGLKQSESEILKTINGNAIYYQDKGESPYRTPGTPASKFIYWYSESQLWVLAWGCGECIRTDFNKQDFINFAQNFYEKYLPTANIY